MTDWMDPEQVRSEVTFAEMANSVWFDRDNFYEQMKQARMSLCVLEAIAAMPEPDCTATCEAIPQPDGTIMMKAIDIDSTLHRIWRIARIVTGKDSPPKEAD